MERTPAEILKARTQARLVNSLNQFKRELASEGYDVSRLTVEFVIDLLEAPPEPEQESTNEETPDEPPKPNRKKS